MLQQVAAHHLSRLACLYVRQSALQQVFKKTESTARQYVLYKKGLSEQSQGRVRCLSCQKATNLCI